MAGSDMSNDINGSKNSQNGAEAEASGDSSSSLSIESILKSISETAYRWDLLSDEMVWGTCATGILNVPDASSMSTGSAYGMLIDTDYASERYATIRMSAELDEGEGVPYRVKYRLMPLGRRHEESLWVEEHGRWFAGNDGRPAEAAGVVRVITDRYEEEQKLLFLSGHDGLTGQINRARLTEVLAGVLENPDKQSEQAAFLLVAIDNLTLINDTFGFHVGDEVIASIGKRLRSELREVDSIGRYSSNKFGAVVTECDSDQLIVVAERMLDIAKESMVSTSSAAIPVTISIGAVRVPVHADTVQDVIGRALEALDITKASHSGSFAIYEPSPKRESVRQRNALIADEIISALNENRMRLALQPMVDAKTNKAPIHECLLRLEKPDGSIVSAGEFIPVAEQLGLSKLIDHRVLELSIALFKDRKEGDLSINVSGLATEDDEWVSHLKALTHSNPELRKRIIVEITETVEINQINATVEFVKSLKEIGCRVAIDDFGSGYTSYRNIKHLDVDILKIDGSFVQNILENHDDQIFLKNLTELAHSFELETVAEWVEDEETAVYLRDLGITYLQGFHCGKPELVEIDYCVGDSEAEPEQDAAAQSAEEPAQAAAS